MIHAEKAAIEALYRKGTGPAHAPFPGHAGGVSLKRGGECGHGTFYAVEFLTEQVVRYPEAEGRPPVVIARNVVVQTETFRAFAHQTGGGAGHDVGNVLPELRKGGFKEKPGKGESVERHAYLAG